MTAVDPIVVGTDGSQTAERAVQKAGELAQALGTRVCVVSSCSPSTGSWMAAAGGVAIAEPDTASAKEVVARASRLLADLGVESSGHVCNGDAAQALMAIAEGEGAQMIVVGNRGMSGARRVLGSVPNRISHQAGCAVLIVPTG